MKTVTVTCHATTHLVFYTITNNHYIKQWMHFLPLRQSIKSNWQLQNEATITYQDGSVVTTTINEKVNNQILGLYEIVSTGESIVFDRFILKREGEYTHLTYESNSSLNQDDESSWLDALNQIKVISEKMYQSLIVMK